MKKHYKILSTILATSMLATATSQSVSILADTTFERYEAVEKINDALGFDHKAIVNFSDVKDTDFADDFSVAKENGYYKGFGGNLAMPKSGLTREDAYVLIGRAFNIKENFKAPVTFSDSADLSQYSKGYVLSITNSLGLKSGESVTFAPKELIGEKEFSSIVNAITPYIISEPTTISDKTLSGNVSITGNDVTLSKVTIDGNLYLLSSDSSNIVLDNVTVKGVTYADASYTNNNSDLGTVSIVNEEENALLSSLEVLVSEGGLISSNLDAFNPNKTEYKLSVSNDVSLVQILPTAKLENSKIYINGTRLGEFSTPLDMLMKPGASMAPLMEGDNSFDIKVVSYDDKVSNYTLNINREDLSDVRDEFLAFTYVDEETGQEMPYRLFVPEGYNPEDKDTKYPLILFLHGSGERGYDNEAQLSANKGAVVWATDEVQDITKAFVLAPQASDELVEGGFGLTRDEAGINLVRAYEYSRDTKVAKKILDDVIENYNIDTNNLLATGLSQGGFGVLNLALEYPNLFKKVGAIAGGTDTNNENIKNLTSDFWLFHAVKDNVIPVTESEKVAKALEEAGVNVTYTEYDENTHLFPVGHMSWIPAYNDEDFINWFIK